jgi:hypothetical protein
MNPAARLKELHDLDNPSPTAKQTPRDAPSDTPQPALSQAEPSSNLATDEQRNAHPDKPANPGADEPGSVSTHASTNLEASAPGNPLTRQRTPASAQQRSTRSERAPDSLLVPVNPVLDAMRQDLLAPYPSDLKEDHYKASTVRLPAVLWERLDTASTFLKKTRHAFHDKQDIVAEALKQYLVKVGKEQV